MTEDDAPQMPPDIPEYLSVWSTYGQRAVWERVIAQGGNKDVALGALSALPEASALDALKANRAAVDLLVGRRWYVMREAREAGATWEAIGDALGVTKQGAQDYYRRKIEKQEMLVSDLHDAARARAVLDEGVSPNIVF
ncbi:hypothetical protein IV500_20425 [Paeniglutamicibacter antarcticus]|uniref:Uncharacterized protein n=1 Tax=Arthrobacter terrae TaxID=2935737 RepID=A0A931CT23_9MICC|nr:hypothetical protein [Arthrobacter terrae]MBG0741726.1 hypothetical protein [Arthrobacter terrae]